MDRRVGKRVGVFAYRRLGKLENMATYEFDSIKILALVSDTHGLLRDSVTDALQDVDLIIHAGDIGNRSLLQRLEAIAPVIAVRGNVDHKLVYLPLAEVVSVNGRLIYVLHDLNLLDLDPATAGFVQSFTVPSEFNANAACPNATAPP